MVSKRSPSSARSARRAEATSPFLAALDAGSSAPEAGTLAHEVLRAIRSGPLQYCYAAVSSACDEAGRASRGERLERLLPPSNLLPPVA